MKVIKKNQQRKRDFLINYWSRISKIERVFYPNYDGQEGIDSNGNYYYLLTNLSKHKLPVYIKAILTYSLPKGMKFGFSDEAWAFNEDEGFGYRLDDDTVGFYIHQPDRGDLSHFWKHYDEVELTMHPNPCMH